MPTKGIRAIFNPGLYHGWKKKRHFFEGWYYKIVSADEEHVMALIPGIAMDKSGRQQAFVQVLDGKKCTTNYNTFSVNDFVPASDKFDLQIANNRFSLDSLSLDLEELSGELRFANHVNWPSSWYSPNIMGPFSFFPFLECYHGIMSMNHSIQGSLIIGKNTVDFTGGKGYLEKDWGHSFPSAHIWMQSNHFTRSDVSMKASVAKVPLIGSKFIGFIAGIWINGAVIQFTSYNFSKLKRSIPGDDLVEIILENRNYRLEINAHKGSTTQLIAPIGGLMVGRVDESMNAEIHVKLTDKRKNEIILEDIGRTGALEVSGRIDEITVGA